MAIVTEKQAVNLLRQGQVVALPTETVYGLAGRIDSEATLRKIFAIKQRPFFDPLIVHVHSIAQAKSLCSQWPEIFDLLIANFWPGPLTLIAPKNASVSSIISSGLDTVGIRCPDHPLTLALLRTLGTPLAAPSANRFGHTSPTTAAHVEEEFAQSVAVLDGGPCAVGVESTVLAAELSDDTWWLKILRPGGISRAQIRDCLKGANIKFELFREESSASPGHLKSHYKPAAPLILLNQKLWSKETQAEAEKQLQRPLNNAVELRLPETPHEAARVLFEEFRRLSLPKDAAIYVTRSAAQNGEDWEAVFDRIVRAASVTLI